MVFFTCNHCGGSVKKPSVEKHYNFTCRGRTKSISCMDCQKDFHGEEYVAHTKCITEAEKYSGKDYVQKVSSNSGAKKQESWMDIIRSILESSDYNLSASARGAFERLQSVDNVPRKKAKFQNFVGNCMRMPNKQAEEVWNVLEKEIEKMKQTKQQETAATKAAQEAAKAAQEAAKLAAAATNGDAKKPKEDNKKKAKTKHDAAQCNGDEEPAAKKSKKQKVATATAEENTNNVEQEFAWLAVLKKIADKHVDGIPLEKLKKKVLKKYNLKLGLVDLSEKQQKKFEKKFAKNLKKCSDLQLQDNVVKAG